jgi:hypothetical protein
MGLGATRITEAIDRTAEIIEHRLRGLKETDIQRVVGCSQSTVNRTITKFKKVFKELENVEDYKTVKADLLSAAQIAALESAFSGNKLNKAGFLSTLQGFDILNKAERLERGQSTENLAHSHFGRVELVNDIGKLPKID